MKDLRLKKLILNNFKGIHNLEVNFDSKDTNISGCNASGKTTLNDSYTWLLFNKDSKGASDFDIKTKLSDGSYLHHLQHSVEGIFENNGEEIKLKKVYAEKYTKKRGSATEEFTGHTTDYFVDDVPKKKAEYEAIINELIDKDLFQIATDPLFFNDDSRFNWKNRRKLLIDICGDVSDEDVINANADLQPLKEELKGKSVEDFRLMVQSKMKPINQEIKNIPIKINEAKIAIPKEVEEVDESQIALFNETINQKEKEKFNMMNGGLLGEKEAELIKLENRKLLIENEVPNNKKLIDEKMVLENQRDGLRSLYQSISNKINRIADDMKSNDSLRNSLRNDFLKLNSENYDESNNVCPTCHQMLPAEQIEGFKEKFNVEKSNKLESLNAKGKQLKSEFDEMKKESDDLHEQLAKVSEEGNQIKLKIDEVEKKISEAVEVLEKDKKQRIGKVELQMIDLKKEIQSLKDGNVKAIQKVDDEINSLKADKSALESCLSAKQLKERQEKRIAELEDEEKRLSKEYQRMDQLLFLTDSFVKAKVSMLSEKINSRFKLCRFKLFEEQINGGIVECCEVTVDGVNFSDLNNAMKINSGLDVVNVVCDFKKTYLPIFIDNAEAVNETIKTHSQQIRLYVTKDKELIIENEK